VSATTLPESTAGFEIKHRNIHERQCSKSIDDYKYNPEIGAPRSNRGPHEHREIARSSDPWRNAASRMAPRVRMRPVGIEPTTQHSGGAKLVTAMRSDQGPEPYGGPSFLRYPGPLPAHGGQDDQDGHRGLA
jgi:hypothetical protein